MGLKIKQVEFFVKRISSADYHTFASAIQQLLKYLEKEAVDNPVCKKYEQNRQKWAGWLGRAGWAGNWDIPNDFEEAKSLAYHLYKLAAEGNDQGDRISLQLFGQTHLEDNVYKFNQSFLDFFIKALEDILNAEPQISKGQQINEITGDKIFIIHGHDKELKNEVQLLLYRAGVDDIVLHEQPDKGRTIIDKLIEESKDACYVIALLSPDDELANGTSQARQNVILEIGYFLGKLGKERVRLLKKGQVDIPSDLQGILYEVYDKDGAWRIKLLKEMKAAGISIDVDSVLKKF
jgi:predicted nucleotide-binding protein